MARPTRIEYPGACYFVSAAGQDDLEIFYSEDNKQQFLLRLNEICSRFHWCCYAFCILHNSYSLILKTPVANLAKGMRELNGVFTQQYNQRNQRVGSVLKGRYKAILIEPDNDELWRQLNGYISTLALQWGFSKSAAAWKWSHVQALLGKAWAPKWLRWREMLELYSQDTGEARRILIDKLSSANKFRLPKISQQQFLGNAGFMLEMKELLPPIESRSAQGKTFELKKYWSELQQQNMCRNKAIMQIYASEKYSLKEIGQFLGLHYSSISRILKNASRTP